jgi:hypothetical protein
MLTATNGVADLHATARNLDVAFNDRIVDSGDYWRYCSNRRGLHNWVGGSKQIALGIFDQNFEGDFRTHVSSTHKVFLRRKEE